MTVPAILWVDKWGRRNTMIFGALMMSLFLWVVGGILSTGYWYIGDDGKWSTIMGSTSKSNGMVACIYLFVASFATTWGPLGWIYPAEIFPLRIRAVAVSLSTAANWLFNWVLNFVVPMLMQRIRFGLYMLFAGFNFLMAVHVFLAYPETKGYTVSLLYYLWCIYNTWHSCIFIHSSKKWISSLNTILAKSWIGPL